jgi:hypothetical protein
VRLDFLFASTATRQWFLRSRQFMNKYTATIRNRLEIIRAPRRVLGNKLKQNDVGWQI